MARPIAVLDANVIYPARLRDLLMRLAIAGLYQARWTNQILDECFQNLIIDRPDLPIEQLSRTRELMNVALPDALLTNFDHLIAGIELPDLDDRHVLAAALKAEATHLVTANLRDFPLEAIARRLSVVSPDDFVLMLAEDDLDTVLAVIETQATALRYPSMTTLELLEGLEAVGLSTTVQMIRPQIR